MELAESVLNQEIEHLETHDGSFVGAIHALRRRIERPKTRHVTLEIILVAALHGVDHCVLVEVPGEGALCGCAIVFGIDGRKRVQHD